MALVGGLFNGVSKSRLRAAGAGAGGGLSYKEFIVLFSLLSGNFYLGLNPNTFLDLVIWDVRFLLSDCYRAVYLY
jgi:hypothetical protein